MNIILIGFMGTYKSTVGRLLAENLRMLFVDTDAVIEKKFGMPVNAIFQTHGEAAFRQAERELCAQLPTYQNAVMATGGGMPAHGQNGKLLRQAGRVIWLQATPRAVYDRLIGDNTRPLLHDKMDVSHISALMLKRQPFYESCCHFAVDTTGKTPSAVASEILEQLKKP